MGEDAPKLIVCGTGPMEEWCKEYVTDNKLNVEMRGFVLNEETRKLIARSRAMILPTQWYEGFPMSIVEAFSVGTPVLCSDLGNAGNIVEERVSGYKFNSNSLKQVIETVDKCTKMYTSTFDLYKRNYQKDVNYKQLVSEYGKLKL